MLQAIGDRGRGAGIPILVDPARGRDWLDHGQVTLIKANRVEATRAVGDEMRPLAMERRLADEHRCSVIMTYGRHGMVAAERDGEAWYLPAEGTQVRDVCGAGDTLFAAIAVGLLSGDFAFARPAKSHRALLGGRLWKSESRVYRRSFCVLAQMPVTPDSGAIGPAAGRSGWQTPCAAALFVLQGVNCCGVPIWVTYSS
jgi:hypothetical protein